MLDWLVISDILNSGGADSLAPLSYSSRVLAQSALARYVSWVYWYNSDDTTFDLVHKALYELQVDYEVPMMLHSPMTVLPGLCNEYGSSLSWDSRAGQGLNGCWRYSGNGSGFRYVGRYPNGNLEFLALLRITSSETEDLEFYVDDVLQQSFDLKQYGLNFNYLATIGAYTVTDNNEHIFGWKIGDAGNLNISAIRVSL